MDNRINKFFSVVIPCWEIKGKGVDYLEWSFNILANQTFKDFEVVISDHSVDDEIRDLCDRWLPYLDIIYTKNSHGRGKISPNLNNAIRHATGKYIKILFQDDFLYDQESLEIIYKHIINNAEKYWFVNACVHTKDAVTCYDPMFPMYHDRIHEGYNTISCPTVLTIKNENVMEFDESLNWLVDVDYYKRLYINHGLPVIIQHICAVNRDSEVRTTTMITEQEKIEEVKRVIERYNNQKYLDLSKVTLIAVTSVRLQEHIKALMYSSKNIKFGAIKLVSHEKPENLPDKIQFEYIEKMNNINEWNYSMIYKLGKYIDTEFAMVIHDDGFVINPSSWKNEFFDYDYIGAPWPIPHSSDKVSYRDINGELIRVGNSVSLRSKKLIDLPNQLNLEWKAFHGYYSEDGYIAVNYRHIYKEYGCKFADLNIAKYFSHETEIPETIGIAPFAFHGKNSVHRQLLNTV
jgi:hypothetical protein